MKNHTILKRLLMTSRRLHAAATRLDPDDVELAEMADTLDEIAQALQDLEALEEASEEDEA